MRKRLLLPVICMAVLALSGCAKNSAGNAEISTEMHHKYLESCSCPADEDGVVRKHLDGCEVPKISEKVEIVADMYTSNRITKDGYATYQYVVTDKEYAGYFDKKNHIKLDLSKEQLEWAKLAAEDELNMPSSSFDEFMENYYNALTDGQMKVWNEIWGVEY